MPSYYQLYFPYESYPLQSSHAPPVIRKATNRPVKATPPPVNDILVLNDDCLLHILSFVAFEDLLHLRFIHARFKSLFRIAAKKILHGRLTIMIDEDFFYFNPLSTSRDVYAALSDKTVTLLVELKKEDDFLSILKFFPNIRTLKITNTELRTVTSIKKYPPVQELLLDTPNIPVHYAKRLFRHLDKSLVRLSYPLHYTKDLLVLHNLTNIRIPIDGIRRGLKGKDYYIFVIIFNEQGCQLCRKLNRDEIPGAYTVQTFSLNAG